MFNLLVLCNTKRSKYLHQSLRTKQTHQVVLHTQVEAALAGVTLTAGTTAELVINPSAFMDQTVPCQGAAGFGGNDFH